MYEGAGEIYMDIDSTEETDRFRKEAELPMIVEDSEVLSPFSLLPRIKSV